MLAGRGFWAGVLAAQGGAGRCSQPGLAPLCRAGPEQPRAPPAHSQVWGSPAAALPRRDAGLPGTGGAGRAVFQDSQWVAGAGASFTGGLTLRLSWQKGQVVHLVLIHLPGGVDYKTNIRTFTVSAGPQQGAGRHGKPWVSNLGTPPTPKVLFLPQHPITALSTCLGGSRGAGGVVQADGHHGPPGSAGVCPLPHQRGQ